MATFSKALLSYSIATDGKQISVAATSQGGTNIHQAGAGADAGAIDEIWIYATNGATKDTRLTFEWGAASSDTDEIIMTIPPRSGLILAIPGLILTNGLYVKAYAQRTPSILLSGYVNRVT